MVGEGAGLQLCSTGARSKGPSLAKLALMLEQVRYRDGRKESRERRKRRKGRSRSHGLRSIMAMPCLLRRAIYVEWYCGTDCNASDRIRVGYAWTAWPAAMAMICGGVVLRGWRLVVND
jgi:hypothetical protein